MQSMVLVGIFVYEISKGSKETLVISGYINDLSFFSVRRLYISFHVFFSLGFGLLSLFRFGDSDVLFLGIGLDF